MISLWSGVSLIAWLWWRVVWILCWILHLRRAAATTKALARRAMTIVEYWDPPLINALPELHPRKLPLDLWRQYDEVGLLYGGFIAVKERHRDEGGGSSTMPHASKLVRWLIGWLRAHVPTYRYRMFHVRPDMTRAYPHDFEWVTGFVKGRARALEGDRMFPIDTNGNEIHEQQALLLD